MRTASIAARLPFFYGWVVVGVAFITMSVGVSARTGFSLLFPEILDEFGWERGVTAAAFSIGFAASMALLPVIGFAMTRFGPRVVIPCGAAITAAGLFGATFATTPIEFYATLGIMTVTFAVAMSYLGHSLFLPNWFARKRGLAIGIAFSGVGVGAIVLLPWLQTIIEADGWRAACVTLAVLIAVVVIPLNIIAQRREPAALGLEPDGDRSDAGDSETKINPIIDRAWAETEWTVKLAIRTGRFWWIAAAYFTSLVAWYSVQVHQTKHLIDVGFAPEFAALSLGLVGFCGIFGQIGVGGISDRIGREWAWTIALSGFTACYLALIAVQAAPSPILVYVIIGTQGLLGYGVGALYGTIGADVFAGRQFASVFAIVSLGGNLGAATGPWITGLIYDRTGSYTGAFTLCAALSLVSILCIWIAAPRKVRLAAGVAARRAS